MLKIDNPYFSLTLPAGWEQLADQEGVDVLSFGQAGLMQKIVIGGLGLHSCPSEKLLRAELQRIIRQKKIEWMRDEGAAPVDRPERLTKEELSLEFLTILSNGARFMHVRSHLVPRDEAHIVLLFSFEDRSEAASLQSVSSSAGKVLEGLKFL